MSEKRIFVSHAHQDAAYCRQLVAVLHSAGADVWYDEHNLGPGHLMSVIQRELEERPYFIVILSPSAFASDWVRDECTWAYSLSRRDQSRVILPVTAVQYDVASFAGARGWLFLESFKRIEDDGLRPLPTEEATRRVLRAFGLDGAVGDSRSAPPSHVPPPPAATIQWQSLIEDYISANNLSEAYDAGHKLIEAGKASFDWSIILAAFAASRLEFQRQWGATLRNALLSGKVAGTDWQGLLEEYVAGGNLSEAYETGQKLIVSGQGNFDWSIILAAFAASRLEFQRQWGKTLRDALMKQM